MTLLILRPPWRTTEEVLWWKTPVMETHQREEKEKKQISVKLECLWHPLHRITVRLTRYRQYVCTHTNYQTLQKYICVVMFKIQGSLE
jgi:hypothetical protein